MIKLKVLGGLELSGPAGRRVEAVLAQPKRLGLLAFLALNTHRGFIRRDTLLAMFWPELDDAHARGALSQALRFLRRELDDRLIERRGDEELALAPAAVSCDAVLFERACAGGDWEAAIAAYRGPLLDGVFISDAPGFDRWLEGQRARLARAYAQALEATAARLASRGEHRESAECWRRRAESEPYNATVAQKFMLALDAAGDRAGAIAHARVHARCVATELGADLDPAVAHLAERLRSAVLDHVPEVAHTAPVQKKAMAWWRPRTASLAAVAFVAAIFALLIGPRRPASDAHDQAHVAVLALQNETGRADLDFVGLEVQDWITRGLQETGLVRVFAAPGAQASTQPVNGDAAFPVDRRWADRAQVGTLIVGRYYLRGDTILMQVSVVAATDGKVIATPSPVAAPVRQPAAAIDTLRQRTIGVLAAYLDPALREWAAFASQPPSFEAYREFSRGQKAFDRDDYRGAVGHYLRAAALDSSYVYPLLMAAQIRDAIGDGEFPPVDSLLRIVRQHRRLQPFDEALASEVEATRTGDYERWFDAAQDLRKFVAPGSTWDLDAVNAAVALNRPGDAMAIVRGIDLHREAALDHWSVFIGIGNAYHLAGEDAALIPIFQTDARKWQYGALIVVDQIRALAALARANEADSLWQTMLQRKGGERSAATLWTAAWGAAELRAHGSPLAGRRLALEALDSLPNLPDSSHLFGDPLLAKLQALREAGREREAWPIADALVAKYPKRAPLLGIAGALAAQLGDTATAGRISARLASWEGDKDQMRSALLGRARIAATLGGRDTAVALLHAACDHGCSFMEDIHALLEFDGLRSYRPFQEFLQPRQ